MRTVLGNCGCLILSILLLPLFLILIGPLLMLAALRGRQPIGPIMLNTSRYGLLGRTGAFLLGLAIWILVWSGLVWVVINGLLPASTVTYVPADTPAVVIPTDTLSPSTESQEETPILPSSTFTAVPTPLPTATPTNTPTTEVVISPTPVLTATPPLNETPTMTPEPTTSPESDQSSDAGDTQITSTGSLTAPLTLTDRQEAIAAVEEGNLLLREAISLANEENVRQLEKMWQGKALDKAQNFVTDLYGRYAKPFDVRFEYIISPTISSESTLKQAIIVSQESWAYQGRTGVDTEAFEFTYTLSKETGRWIITRYYYLNLTTPTPIPTNTVTPTPTGQ